MSGCSNPCVWSWVPSQEQSHSPFLSWAELGGETQALKVSFHLEDSLSLDRLAHSSPFSSDISSLLAPGWPTPNLLRLHVISWSPAWSCGPSSLLSLLWYGPPRPRWKEPVSVGRRCKTSKGDTKGKKSCGTKTESSWGAGETGLEEPDCFAEANQPVYGANTVSEHLFEWQPARNCEFIFLFELLLDLTSV